MRSILGSLGATLLVALAMAATGGGSQQDKPAFGESLSVLSAGPPVTGHGTMDTYATLTAGGTLVELTDFVIDPAPPCSSARCPWTAMWRPRTRRCSPSTVAR